MPLFSAFTGFGFLEFSSEPSEHEKVYTALIASYTDPRTGRPAIDVSEGTHQEAKIYAWAGALGGARVNLRRAGNELRPETSYAMLEAHEARFAMSPASTDSVPTRRTALAAKQKAVRGPRYEAVVEGLAGILGANFVAYRPINTTEAVAYPADPGLPTSPGIFRRSDAVGASVRMLTAVTRLGTPQTVCDERDDANRDDVLQLRRDGLPGAGESFKGNGGTLALVRFFLKKTAAPTGTLTVKLYAHSGTFGTTGIPTGPALATSSTILDPSTLTGAYVLHDFEFRLGNRVKLTLNTPYFVTIEASDGVIGANRVDVGADTSASPGPGTAARQDAFFAWTSDGAGKQLIFDVLTGYEFEVSYENWNDSLVEIGIVPGDVLCVDPGVHGLAERVVVSRAAGTGTSRTFTAAFENPHSAGTFAGTGSTPIWTNTKRHALVIVKAAAAIDPATVRGINDLFRRMMRGPTTWAIVQPTTPGALTLGPFKIGDTLGSPLGAVPIESITI